MSRAVRYAVVALFSLAALLTATNILFTVTYVHASDRKWCTAMTLLTARPVPKPADPKANPSRQASWQFYQTFLDLRRNLGCG